MTLLSGDREAELSGLGVITGINRPDGVVGDLGGGSLELIDVKGARAGKGTSLPLGGLTLMDASGRSPRGAVKIAREALAGSRIAERVAGRTSTRSAAPGGRSPAAHEGNAITRSP